MIAMDRCFSWMVMIGFADAAFFVEKAELTAALLQWAEGSARQSLVSQFGEIGQWDVSRVQDMSFLLAGAAYFNEDISQWNTSAVTNMSGTDLFNLKFFHVFPLNTFSAQRDSFSARFVDQPQGGMFVGLPVFNQPIGQWDTSAVTDMAVMFSGAGAFNQPLSTWNTSAVRSMNGMFSGALSFNQDIGAWDTSAVRDVSDMFNGAISFNQPVGGWNLSSVKSMIGMFAYAFSFNQPLGDWDTSAVENMRGMFKYATSFDQPIGRWNTSSVRNMTAMFHTATTFNQAVGDWDTSKVVGMAQVFLKASHFNQPIGTWDTSSAVNMAGMFNLASSFNQPIGVWEVSSVKNMSEMFAFATSFNQPIGDWDTSSVEDMKHMFENAQSFNQPLGFWNTSRVKAMSRIFEMATSFNQPVGSWDISGLSEDEDEIDPRYFFVGKTGSSFSPCIRSSMYRSFNLSLNGAIEHHYQCPECTSRRCPHGSLACIGGTCAPVNSGYVELWASTSSCGVSTSSTSRFVAGFRQCAEACSESTACAAFAWQKTTGSCELLACDLSQLQMDSSTSAVKLFLKQSCESFTCPPLTYNTLVPKFAAISAASCCTCASGNMVTNMDSQDFQCVTCPAGTAPNGNQTLCVACRGGTYSLSGSSSCETCPTGFIVSSNRTSCEACPRGTYSFQSETCETCSFPMVLYENGCIWWHIPLIAFGCVLVAVCIRTMAGGWRKHSVKKKMKKQADIRAALAELENELWKETEETESKHTALLQGLGLSSREVEDEMRLIRARQSSESGVGMLYLLSHDFSTLARTRAQEQDPTFNSMKPAFWLCENPLGKDVICPRDGKAGCSLVDWIPRSFRQRASHFMSWTWAYHLSQVQGALEMWLANNPDLDAQQVFFFMCFFTNNQFRILVEGSAAGTDDLETAFRTNLTRIGKMVALLDHWYEPRYLTRVWTIYEQFVACSLTVPVVFVMPESSQNSLKAQICRGEVGISYVTDSLSQVDSAKAQAFYKSDEDKVKDAIRQGVGFDAVNKHVTRVMAQWIGGVVQDQFQRLIDERAGQPA